MTVGMIVDKLKECGLYEDTSDYLQNADRGLHMGAHRLIEKGFTFDEIYRVPLVVKGLVQRQ